jgi:excinuclease ABC subunit B
MHQFRLKEGLSPKGDQPKAISTLVEGIQEQETHQILHGVTGSGKTMTMAWVIESLQRPTLILAHNKTLAAQLYREFRELFPDNAVEYFVSYYDYYQPEAYVPSSDVFIEKDAKINEQIDRMRHSATRALFERRDVIIIASVSCIYGIGSAEAYHQMLLHLQTGQTINRQDLLRQLIDIQYARNDIDFHRGTFRVRGDVVEIFPAHEEERAIRIEFWDDEIEAIKAVDPFRGEVLEDIEGVAIYPNSHHVTESEQLKRAINTIRDELQERLAFLKGEGKLIEEQRLRERTICDLEMLEQMGFCHGIENYSRHLSGRKEGEPPPCLLDYFPEDFLIFVDESHVTLPQIRGMYRGDRARKMTLVEYGFRLPSALDNRPLKFEEFLEMSNQNVYVSATPGTFEMETSTRVAEQIIRPTGLLDPIIEIRPVGGQVDDLLEEIKTRTARGERILITTLTKRMSEKLAEYYQEMGVNIRYLHSDIDTIERIHLLVDLRKGVFDVLVGINLLREGLDLPEVSLVAIFDADQQGFLRSSRSLLQTAGRAARNANGRVILYADKMTEAIEVTVKTTQRQRALQMAYNEEHGITPVTIQKQIKPFEGVWAQPGDQEDVDAVEDMIKEGERAFFSHEELLREIESVEIEMLAASQKLAFEEAAKLRDRMQALQQLQLFLEPEPTSKPSSKKRKATA